MSAKRRATGWSRQANHLTNQDVVPAENSDTSVLATEELLFQELRKMYNGAVSREICNIILFYNDVLATPFVEALEVERATQLDGLNYRKMFNTWTGGQEGLTGSKMDTEPLYQESLERAKIHNDIDAKRRLARYLLQASSFLDLDVLFEPVPDFLATEKLGRASVEHIPRAIELGQMAECWRGIFCSECSYAIRSSFCFECEEGCQSHIHYPVLILQDKWIRELSKSPGPEWEQAMFRLCPPCASKNVEFQKCQREHLRRVYLDNEFSDKKIRRLQAQIEKHDENQREKNRDDRQNRNFITRWLTGHRGVVDAVDKLADGVPFDLGLIASQSAISAYASIEPTRGRFLTVAKILAAPAGAFHTALMFGPLILESGVEGSKYGAMISPRPLPNLLPYNNIATSSIDGKDTSDTKDLRPSIIFYKRKGKASRRIQAEIHDVNKRTILGTVKRVYGAAFSGYQEGETARELEFLDALLPAARKCGFGPVKSLRARSKGLNNAARRVFKPLNDLIGPNVDRHLRRFARILMSPQVNLSWQIIFNSCQKFVDTLLRGKDFECVLPRLLKEITNSSQDEDNDDRTSTRPRYIISFGDRLDVTHIFGRQHNSFITRFSQRRKIQADLIDFIELSHHGEEEKTTEPRGLIDACNEILLKPTEPDPRPVSIRPLDVASLDAPWDMPRDTLSILHFHILRPFHMYQNSQGKMLKKDEWIVNRLRVLRQLDIFASLAGGLSSALSDLFHRDSTLLWRIIIPKSRVYGTLRADERVRIVRPTPWNITYFVFNLQAPDLAPLYDVPDTILEEISQKLHYHWDKHLSKLIGRGTQSARLTAHIEQALVACIIETFRFQGRILAPHQSLMMRMSLADILIRTGISVLKRKVHGEDDWLVWRMGGLVTVLQQNFKKSKNVR